MDHKTTTDAALLPCPFCGGAVSLERAADTRSEIHGLRQWWGVKCRNALNLGGTCAIEQTPSASPEAAIERWNRRAPVSLPAFPERDQSKPAEQQGMFHKFDVRRTDGSSEPGGKHHGCRYFVLDLTHDQHAPAAMRAYAASCRATHPHLAADIDAEFGTDPNGAKPARRKDDVHPGQPLDWGAPDAMYPDYRGFPTVDVQDAELVLNADRARRLQERGPDRRVESLAVPVERRAGGDRRAQAAQEGGPA